MFRCLKYIPNLKITWELVVNICCSYVIVHAVYMSSVERYFNLVKLTEKGNEEVKLTSDVHNRPPY